MAQLGDKVCRWVTYRGIVFGRVVEAVGQGNFGTPTPAPPMEPAAPGLPVLPEAAGQQREVQWEGNATPTSLTEFPYQVHT